MPSEEVRLALYGEHARQGDPSVKRPPVAREQDALLRTPAAGSYVEPASARGRHAVCGCCRAAAEAQPAAYEQDRDLEPT